MIEKINPIVLSHKKFKMITTCPIHNSGYLKSVLSKKAADIWEKKIGLNNNTAQKTK